MSEATSDGQQSLKVQLSAWNLKEHEERSFEQRESIPGWRLADKSRRLLADTCRQLNASLPEIAAQGPDDLLPWANKFAAVEASGIAVRTAGAILSQVSCGYVVEAAGGLRRVIEARLHIRAMLADRGGAYALRFIEGRPSALRTLAKRHGSRQEIDALSQLNHANSRGLIPLRNQSLTTRAGAVEYGRFNVYPGVDPDMAQSLLYVLSKELVGVGQAVCEAFAVELKVTPWVERELSRLDDLAAQTAD